MSEEHNTPSRESKSLPLEPQHTFSWSVQASRKTRAERRQALREANAALEAHVSPDPSVSHPSPAPPLAPPSPNVSTLVVSPQPLALVPQQPQTEQRNPKTLSYRLRWFKQWQFWLAVLIVIPSGIGFSAFALLLKLPEQANCAKVFWLTASATERIYCGDLAAQQGTVDKLLEAISLVNEFPADHPARSQINRKIEEWSQIILNLGEEKFQEGKLPEAITIARKIPESVPVHALVGKTVQRWQSIWNEAESIYNKAEDYLGDEKWNPAFMEATRLLEVGNNYWETTKYTELTQLIQAAKTDGNGLIKARQLADKGGLENLLEAIKLVEKIDPKSRVYAAAQKAIAEFSGKMMDLAESTMEAGDWSQALTIVDRIPESANLKEQIKDFKVLAQGFSKSSAGTIAGLEDAIKHVQQLKSNRPLYDKAQDLVSRWQQEIIDVASLARARQLASPGGLNDLKAGIAQLQTISDSNPRGKEAQEQLKRWTYEVERLEDTPYLERAQRLAAQGDTNSIQLAILEASQINPGRALYGEAQEKIKMWNQRSQRIKDQPILDAAMASASEGNLAAAIDLADQIRPGHSLYDRARAYIRDWQEQLQTQQSLENAQQTAKTGTEDALTTAIILADQVPQSSSQRWKAEDLINQWSQQILEIAQGQASFDPGSAIKIARKIPSGTRAYTAAQSQIATWQSLLNPPPQPLQPQPVQYQAPTPVPQPENLQIPSLESLPPLPNVPQVQSKPSNP